MKYISVNDRLLREQKKNENLRAENAKNTADIDYIAMMCDIELESEEDNDAQPEI